MARLTLHSLLSAALLCLGLAGCGMMSDEHPESGLYAPCETDDDCKEMHEDNYLSCLVSPYGGASPGICSTYCDSQSDDPQNHPIESGGCYDSDSCWLGCCRVDSAWGSGGNGFCLPWALY